ncbi:MAG TPA: UDP-N-acetylmuramate--L-alanine ligase [Cryomorphaceae bacterium]|jgi:UDP-N-acetylmuramate--alanine ligase|nr:MAG: hypothetical protein ABR88_01230 [Cryomorphaceae bacterium BACL7 MAG-120322-bin74]KRO82830.1 MAG: hypothetical protein ABR87_06930 [Cryomorphaceae bacterium BACL7 MAG-121220-bin83]HAB32257.1 UDP-N-acetylmuramate--L-alanine ligase [Cryomorphaceae bacterium]
MEKMMPAAMDFLGIGGIGMSALARWALSQGIHVTGYDKVPSPLTQKLAAEGAVIRYSDQRKDWHIEPEAWVIYTPAIPAGHPQLQAALASDRRVLKRAALLGEIANRGTCLAVAGTHGKTTTSCLLAWILYQSGMPVQAFLGGISSNLNSNFLPGPADITVVEADEFDRSFLHLHPTAAVVTSTDADHLDIYGDSQHVTEAFAVFSAQCQTLYASAHAQGITGHIYGLSGETFRAEDITVEEGRQSFTLVLDDQRITNVNAGLPGLHNIENALGAACLANHVGVSMEAIAEGIRTFQGVRRRFDIRWAQQGCFYIDDYAHHPTEIQRLLEAVRSLYPGKEVSLIFQPHLYSRTRDFLDGFADALQGADYLGILPIYAARELPIPGVDAQALVDLIPHATLLSFEEAATWLTSSPSPIKLTVGAGDIDRLVDPIVEQLQYLHV